MMDTKLYYETMYQDARGIIPLCTITQPQNSDQKPSLQVKGFYDISQIPSLLAETDRLNGDYHVYTGIHPLRERPSEGRGKEKDILGIALFAADVDAKDFIDDHDEKKNANNERAFYRWTDELLSECKAKALTHINSVCEKVSCQPTAIIDSGHGYYPIFKLDKFVEFENDQHREELKKLNKALHKVFTADSTFDFARILRVPNTRNIKPGYPADCKLIEFHPDRCYTLDDIRRFKKCLVAFATIPKVLQKQQKKLISPREISGNISRDKQTLHPISRGELPSAFDDKILIEKAKSAKDGAKFTALWEGDISSYDSPSEADLALCCLLAFWTGGDRDRIDRLFRQSGLCREEKWAGREDYRERTIDAALERVTEFYKLTGNGKSRQAPKIPPQPPVPPFSPLITPQLDAEAFDILNFRCTDSGNAELFAELHGKNVRYDHKREVWFRWNGNYWEIDQLKTVFLLAKNTARARLKAAINISDDDVRAKQAKWAISSEAFHKINACVSLAQKESIIATETSIWDTDDMMLGVRNGTIDLRTGELLPSKRERYVSLCANVEYEKNAKCPRWIQFINEIFDNNQNLGSYIQRAAGYSLTGNVQEHCFFLCHGTGRNGKGTFLNSLSGILRDYAATTAFSTFEWNKYQTNTNDLAALRGIRLVSAQETQEARKLNEARVKSVTGGDPITCRFLNHEFFTYIPKFKVWLSVNHRPLIRDTSLGMWSRVRLIPFNVSFLGREDKQLSDKLKDEKAGILNWALEGCLKWQESGLTEPQEVLIETQKYRDESDPIALFLEEKTIIENSMQTKASDLFAAYEEWAKANGEWSMSQQLFGRRLGEKGLTKEKRGGIYFYHGIGLIIL